MPYKYNLRTGYNFIISQSNLGFAIIPNKTDLNTWVLKTTIINSYYINLFNVSNLSSVKTQINEIYITNKNKDIYIPILLLLLLPKVGFNKKNYGCILKI